MPAAPLDDHRGLLRLPRHAEGAVEGMQDVGVVRVARVLVVVLPVGVDALGVVAEHLERLDERAADAVAGLAEPFGERRRVGRVGREHEPAERFAAQLLQPVVLEPKVGGQPAFAAQAAPERGRLEIAAQVVDPGVVDAVELLRLPELLATDEVPAVRAAVDHRPQRTRLVAAHDDRRISDTRALERTGLRDLRVESDVVPDRPAEDPRLLARVDVGIREDPVGRAAGALLRPGACGRYGFQCAHWISSRQLRSGFALGAARRAHGRARALRRCVI